MNIVVSHLNPYVRLRFLENFLEVNSFNWNIKISLRCFHSLTSKRTHPCNSKSSWESNNRIATLHEIRIGWSTSLRRKKDILEIESDWILSQSGLWRLLIEKWRERSIECTIESEERKRLEEEIKDQTLFRMKTARRAVVRIRSWDVTYKSIVSHLIEDKVIHWKWLHPN